jgi:uncharacterized protein (DUF488 family)
VGNNLQKVVAHPSIFTIGHSDRTLEEFVDTLRRYEITVVVDVRTKPASSRHSQFNRAVLENRLPPEGIRYLYLGEGLGAFRTEPEALNSAGQVWYRNVRKLASFKADLERVESGVQKGYRIVLMCAEGDPHNCHRFPMIAYQLIRDGLDVQHILRDGTARPHAELENEMLDEFSDKIPKSDLLQPDIGRAQQLDAAYDQLNLRIVRKLAGKDRGDDADAPF